MHTALLLPAGGIGSARVAARRLRLGLACLHRRRILRQTQSKLTAAGDAQQGSSTSTTVHVCKHLLVSISLKIELSVAVQFQDVVTSWGR